MIINLQKASDTTNKIYFTMNTSHLEARKIIAGTNTTVSGQVLYDTVMHRWLRIRESGGTIFWETSPDSINWFLFKSLANPFYIISLQPVLSGGDYNTTQSISYA